MRIEITKDVCVDPPLILSMSECEEYFECDPHYHKGWSNLEQAEVHINDFASWTGHPVELPK